MCGIFSVYMSSTFTNKDKLKDIVSIIATLSQTRGQDATGIAVNNFANKEVYLYREPLKAKEFIKKRDFDKIFQSNFTAGVCVVGHNRLATNGSNAYINNNQPISYRNHVCAQNGIVTNMEELIKEFPGKYELDTYLISEIFDKALKEKKNIKEAVKALLEKVYGENNIIFDLPDLSLKLLTTNTGSIYYINDIANGFFIAASERYILQRFLQEFKLKAKQIEQLRPHHFLILDYNKNLLTLDNIYKTNNENIECSSTVTNIQPIKIIDIEDKLHEKFKQLKRCTKCILPETFPGISFNGEGVCNICISYLPVPLKGSVALEEVLSKYRKKEGQGPDCLVAFSGGRDSSYGLHLLKNKYKMTPLAYSYDWGMVTDLARRNQARMCSKLGVEHIWVAADIRKKRENIRKNVEAWIKRPDIGMIPIFMAGDKTYFYHANQLMKKNNLKLIIFCPNHLEKTSFKAGYCGVDSSNFGSQVHQLTFKGKAKLLAYYARQYLQNPRYINSSMLDVFFGFLSYYVMNQDFLYLFDFEPWLESSIDKQLKEEYDWEWDSNYSSSWRIGDGTAPLYNYIYYIHAGFTENDCLRSNQIREGMIDRETALTYCARENIPRLEDIEEYCKMINVNFVDLVNAIRSLKYDQ